MEPYWPLLFAKLAEKRNLSDLIMNVGAGGGGGAVAVAAPTGGAAAGGAAAAPAAEEKKVNEISGPFWNLFNPELRTYYCLLNVCRRSQRKKVMMIWDSVCSIRSCFQYDLVCFQKKIWLSFSI